MVKVADVLRDSSALPGLSVDYFQPDQLNVPHAWVEVDSVDYHHSFSGPRQISLHIYVAVARSGARGAADRILDFLDGNPNQRDRGSVLPVGDWGIVDLLESHPDLNGGSGSVADDITVSEGTEAGQTYIGSTPYPTVMFTVEVLG